MDVYDSEHRKRKKTGALPSEQGSARRPYLGVRFDCCGVYTRLYRPVERPYYYGNCPKCGKAVHIPVAKGGSSSRFFSVS